MKSIRLATRASALAMAQAHWVGARLTELYPEISVSFVEITTTGDADRTSPVTTLTEVGAFVRAVQTAVLEGRADVAVHSCKDLPVAGPASLVSVFPERESPWDVLCGAPLEELPEGARVGTGSPRRAAQLGLLRPDLEVADIRGNIDTRLAKLASGEFAAIVLAEAGLNRTDRRQDMSHRFDLSEMVPAPAQGALALEVIAGSSAAEVVSALDHAATRSTVEAERGLLERTGAGCRAALGVLAVHDGSEMIMSGFVADDAGPRRAEVRHANGEQGVRLLQEALGL
jgi:hydroxymethylbilane synthase